MRSGQKNKILQVLDTLEELHCCIESALRDKQNNVVIEYLENCQSAAIEIGNVIELTEGENCLSVKKLEDYCEKVYCLYKDISLCLASNVLFMVNELNICLEGIVESVKIIPIKKEIVFLPYKASMWDSFETVWQKAVADDSCDVYVISIPYFEKKADGSLGDMYDEASLYPSNVQVTSYEEYDFANRRPDVIFIHNPYDECNYVTTIHPFFYAKNIKQFTEKLVYIPYFVLAEINPDDEKAVAKIEHFITLPGVIHSNRVIVQSENMKQIYVNVLSKCVGENSRKLWEEKILGLGSPKIEKVTTVERNSIELPIEWNNLIYKADGTKKKVVLYNLGLNSVLKYQDKIITKIEKVIECFKMHSEEIVLLWRPHPLIKATIESVQPKLWKEYNLLAEQYKSAGWGIYDDTSDLNRAIAICDAYYGDSSSLVQLCQKVNKPILLQNVEV